MFLEEIAGRLVSAGVGVLGTTIFLSSRAAIPVGPGPFISIVDTGGSGPTRIQNQTGAATQRPTAQIMTRAMSYTVALAKARAAYNALDGVFNISLSGVTYLSIKARQEPTDLGLDDAGRVMIGFNIDAEKQPS